MEDQCINEDGKASISDSHYERNLNKEYVTEKLRTFIKGDTLSIEERNGKNNKCDTFVLQQFHINEEKQRPLNIGNQNLDDVKDKVDDVDGWHRKDGKREALVIGKKTDIGGINVSFQSVQSNGNEGNEKLLLAEEQNCAAVEATVVKLWTENEEREKNILVQEQNSSYKKGEANVANYVTVNKNKEENSDDGKQNGSNVKNEVPTHEEQEENTDHEERSNFKMLRGNTPDIDENCCCLPSTVRDKELISKPPDKAKNDPELFGKWLWFTHADISFQDEMWLRLQSLLENGMVLLLVSSTACTSRPGVIKCYTSKETDDIIRAGRALQSIINDNSILFYKTNQASNDNLYRRLGKRCITKYMVTVSGIVYERDRLERWKKITHDNDAGERSTFTYAPRNVYIPPHKKQCQLAGWAQPSRETEKEWLKFSRVGYSSILEPVGIWYLFCNITDRDNNGMSELDRMWLVAKELYNEGVFVGVSAETAASVRHGPEDNALRRSLSCWIKNYKDVMDVIASGDKLLQRTQYAHPIYMKTTRRADKRNKYYLRYMYTENGELYEHVGDRWNFVQLGSSIRGMEHVTAGPAQDNLTH